MPRRKSVKRKEGGLKTRKIAAAKDFVAGISSGAADAPDTPVGRERTIFIEESIEQLRRRVENRCDYIMSDTNELQDSLVMSRNATKNMVKKRFRNMNVVEYCEKHGEDYDELLLASLPPKEREELLKKAGPPEGEDEDVENDDNDPGTTIKGRGPRPVSQTPADTGKPLRKRNLRSSVKTPALSTRGAVRAAKTATVQTTTRKGKRKGVDDAAVESSESAGGGSSGETSLLTAKVRELLRKGANTDITLGEHLDAIIQPRIDEVPQKLAERCDVLRMQFEEGAAALRAKYCVGSGGKARCSRDKEASALSPVELEHSVEKEEEEGGDGEVEQQKEEEEEEDVLVGGPAKLSLIAEGGPYDGAVFELGLEEDGEARMVGRSTGKKFKQKGISLHKDSEVSTSHGKFENSAGQVTFTDVGSTNGTEVDGEEADQGTAYTLRTGSKLLIGQSVFTATVSWER